jgi:hypothetical protein
LNPVGVTVFEVATAPGVTFVAAVNVTAVGIRSIVSEPQLEKLVSNRQPSIKVPSGALAQRELGFQRVVIMSPLITDVGPWPKVPPFLLNCKQFEDRRVVEPEAQVELEVPLESIGMVGGVGPGNGGRSIGPN